MVLPDISRAKAAPPGEHDMIFIQHIRHKLADPNTGGMLPDGSQQERTCTVALKLIRHGEGDFRRVCILG